MAAFSDLKTSGTSAIWDVGLFNVNRELNLELNENQDRVKGV